MPAHPQTIEIDVTADDIARGERGDSARCPVTLAARRLFPQEVVITGLHHVWIGDDENAVPYRLSPLLYDAVRHFDRWGEMRPRKYAVSRGL